LDIQPLHHFIQKLLVELAFDRAKKLYFYIMLNQVCLRIETGLEIVSSPTQPLCGSFMNFVLEAGSNTYAI